MGLLGVFWEVKRPLVEVLVSVWGVLGSLCGALGVTLRSFGDLGGYRACPKGGEAPVGQGRLGNASDISVIAGNILS